MLVGSKSMFVREALDCWIGVNRQSLRLMIIQSLFGGVSSLPLSVFFASSDDDSGFREALRAFGIIESSTGSNYCVFTIWPTMASNCRHKFILLLLLGIKGDAEYITTSSKSLES